MNIKTRIVTSKPVVRVSDLVTAVGVAKSQIKQDRRTQVVKDRMAVLIECD